MKQATMLFVGASAGVILGLIVYTGLLALSSDPVLATLGGVTVGGWSFALTIEVSVLV